MAINDGGTAFPTMDAKELDRAPSLVSPGMTLRDYFAAHAEPLDAKTQEWIAGALAGRPMPDRELWDSFRAGRCKPDDPTREQWIDYHRWWRQADATHRFIQADCMLEARGEP